MKFDIRLFFKNLSLKLVSLKSDKNNRYFTLKPVYIFDHISLYSSNEKCCRENQSTHFMFNNFFRKSLHFLDNVEKYCTAGQATDDNMAHTNCMLGT